MNITPARPDITADDFDRFITAFRQYARDRLTMAIRTTPDGGATPEALAAIHDEVLHLVHEHGFRIQDGYLLCVDVVDREVRMWTQPRQSFNPDGPTIPDELRAELVSRAKAAMERAMAAKIAERPAIHLPVDVVFGTCATCKHWNRPLEDDAEEDEREERRELEECGLGACSAIWSVDGYGRRPTDKTHIRVHEDGGRAGAWLVTREDFGCVKHERREQEDEAR